MEFQIATGVLSLTTVVFGILWLLASKRPAQESEDSKKERETLKAEVGEKTKRIETLEAKAKELEAARKSLETERDAAKESAGGELSTAKSAAAEAEAKTKTAQADLETARTALETAQAHLEESTGKAEKLRDAQKAAEGKLKEARDHGALALLAWLQREGRLIDFLKEDIDEFDDEQVGAAVRAVHKGCLKVLTEGLDLEAILEGEEESPVQVEAGFDPVAIQLTGNVKGDPPFKGTLMHNGWRAKRVQVPVPETVDPHVLAPAEVEL